MIIILNIQNEILQERNSIGKNGLKMMYEWTKKLFVNEKEFLSMVVLMLSYGKISFVGEK